MLNTKHAACRLQQRGISQMVVDLLLQFGRSEPSGSGTSKFFFDKHSRRKVKAYAGPLAGMLEASKFASRTLSTRPKAV